MKLSELEGEVIRWKEDTATQDKYTLSLGAKIQNGETTIEVYSDDVWTTVPLKDFWQIMYDKYMAMATYTTMLADLQNKLQGELNTALENIATPVMDGTRV